MNRDKPSKLKDCGYFALGFGVGYFSGTSKKLITLKVALLCILSGCLGYYIATNPFISINM